MRGVQGAGSREEAKDAEAAPALLERPSGGSASSTMSARQARARHLRTVDSLNRSQEMPSQAMPQADPATAVEGPSTLQRISKTLVAALSFRKPSKELQSPRGQQDADGSQRGGFPFSANTPFAPITEDPEVASQQVGSIKPDTDAHDNLPDARRRDGAGASAAAATQAAPAEEAGPENEAGWYFGDNEEVEEGPRTRQAGGEQTLAGAGAPGPAGGLEHLEVVAGDNRDRTMPHPQGLPEYDTARSGWATSKLLSASSRSLSSSSAKTYTVHDEGGEGAGQRATTPPMASPFGESQCTSPFAAAGEGEQEGGALQLGAPLGPLRETSSSVEGEALQKVQTAVSVIEKRGAELMPRAGE